MKRRGKTIKRTRALRRITPAKVRPARPSAEARPRSAPDLQRELNGALDQLAATAEVLRVISASPGDLQPAFESVLANATRLGEASFGVLALYEGDERFCIVAMHNAPPAFAELRRREPIFRSGPLTRLAITKQLIHFADFSEFATANHGETDIAQFVKLTGVRTFLGVPLLKDNKVIGAILVYRTEIHLFTDRQVALLTTFATQAVIAIENARLLSELRESLERQTATSEVLGVISRSKFELQPILQSVVDTAERPCHA